MLSLFKKTTMISPENALAGRDDVMPVPEAHHVNGNRLAEPFPDGLEKAMFIVRFAQEIQDTMKWY